uniref:Uncharacterized protein n=1 Tax=Ditylum brightwellii TaxID=49249 RepID=A0A7S2A5R0_9STRA
MSSVFNSFFLNAGKKLWVSVVVVVVVRAVGGLCGWFCALVVCFRRFLCSCISLLIAWDHLTMVMQPPFALDPAFHACFCAIIEHLCWHDEGAFICFFKYK